MTIAPSPSFPERPGNTVDKIIATPRRNALGERAGDRWAEDGTSWTPEYLGSFYGSVAGTDSGTSHRSYDAKIVSGGRSRLGAGDPVPSWDAVPQESLDGFSAGSTGDAGQAYPFPHQPRPGFNQRTLTPLVGLNLGERQNTTIVHHIAPANGGRGKRSIAEITDL